MAANDSEFSVTRVCMAGGRFKEVASVYWCRDKSGDMALVRTARWGIPWLEFVAWCIAGRRGGGEGGNDIIFALENS